MLYQMMTINKNTTPLEKIKSNAKIFIFLTDFYFLIYCLFIVVVFMVYFGFMKLYVLL